MMWKTLDMRAPLGTHHLPFWNVPASPEKALPAGLRMKGPPLQSQTLQASAGCRRWTCQAFWVAMILLTSRSSHRESPHHYIGRVFEQVRKVNPGTSTSDKMSVINSSPSQRLQKLKPSGYRTWNNLDPYHHTHMSHQNGTSLKLEATSNNIQEYIIHNNFENSIFCNNDKCFLSTMIATSKLLPSVQEPLKAQWRHQSKRMCRWTLPKKQWFPSILPGSSGYWWVLTALWTWHDQAISGSNLVKWAHIRQCIDDGCKTYMDIKDIIQCIYIYIYISIPHTSTRRQNTCDILWSLLLSIVMSWMFKTWFTWPDSQDILTHHLQLLPPVHHSQPRAAPK